MRRWPGTPDGFQPDQDAHPTGEVLSSYVDGELELDLRARVDRHLRSCAACRAKVNQFRTASDLFRRVPTERVPLALRRDLYRKIDDHDRRRRAWFGLPMPSGNVLGVAFSAALVLVMIPQLVGVWAFVSGRAGDGSKQASAPDAALAPTSIPLPTTTIAPLPTLASTPAGSPTAAASIEQTAPPVAAVPAQSAQSAPGEPASASQSQPAPTRPAIIATVAPTLAPPRPTPTTAAPVLRTIAGQVTNVNKAQRLLTVQTGSNAEGGSRAWSVQLADSTQVTYKDGRALRADDVGFADYVEVSGFDLGAAPLAASIVKITQSTVLQQQARPKVLVLLDGASSLRPPAYGFTGDWIRRLNETSYDVTPADPSTLSGTTNLREFALIVIGYPATLSPGVLNNVTASKVPVLSGNPTLVQALGLGLNVDPANPTKNVAGKTIDVAGSAAPLTRGFGAETVVGAENVYRTPIVSNGTVLATITDGGQKRSVWSITGSSMYFGFWNSNNGQNHNASYWQLFDRSVLQLLGKDPLAAPTPKPAGR
ncbi:MAG TPA: zf-HC2 domain-containing protein [Chloroflexota bacterium]|nr:zf-HC2 domain-containing protein [Chloroflexota bacterium]